MACGVVPGIGATFVTMPGMSPSEILVEVADIGIVEAII